MLHWLPELLRLEKADIEMVAVTIKFSNVKSMIPKRLFEMIEIEVGSLVLLLPYPGRTRFCHATTFFSGETPLRLLATLKFAKKCNFYRSG